MGKSIRSKVEILQPFLIEPLSPRNLDQISDYLSLLQTWNARVNLTAIRDEAEIIGRHFGESFFLAQHLFPRNDRPLISSVSAPIRVVDIGSGAGFPAIPLKLWQEDIHLTMIEANHKKATFLKEVARALTLDGVAVVTSRAETLAAQPDFPRADVVTFRAVEHFDEIIKVAVTLLAPGGRLAMLVGSRQVGSRDMSNRLAWQAAIKVPLSESRILRIGRLER